MQLTIHFNINEFACSDGTGVPWDLVENVKVLAANLQVLRNYLGEPLKVNSGYRNPTYNKQIGGETDSRHLKAQAADIVCRSKTPRELASIIEKLIKEDRMLEGGIGVYPGFIHYDVRGYKARW